MGNARLPYLFDLYVRRQASAQEEAEFMQLLSEPSNKTDVQKLISYYIIDKESDVTIAPDEAAEILASIFQAGKNIQNASAIPVAADIQPSVPSSSTRQFFPLRAVWLRYAAAMMILIAAGAGMYFRDNDKLAQDIPPDKIIAAPPTQPDAAPGRDRAILTLSDGSTILLDSAATGMLARQGDGQINKLSSGTIQYIDSRKKAPSSTVLYNTMTTPRGGQYKIVLPDGSGVWLNAVSSITYPTAFIGQDRTVVITGEVYFEVAKNEKMPFHVKVHNADIEVLGTHFNVNAYSDEDIFRTTLLEGSIKLKKDNQQLMIRPGEQAQWTASNTAPMEITANVDITKVMAWQKGLFVFSNTGLKAIMREVSRWYDVDVVFEKEHPLRKFGGGVSRKLPLSNLLGMLEAYGVKFKREGKLLKVI